MMEFQWLPSYAGEVTPIAIAFFIGMMFGTQMQGKISRRTMVMILGLAIIAAFLFEAPIFTWSFVGGYIAEGFGFAAPFISAILGMFIGKIVKGGSE